MLFHPHSPVRRLAIPGLAFAWTCLSIATALAVEPWPSLNQESAAEAKIAKALKEDTRIEFIETPLEDVIAFLRDQHDISIQLDRRMLDSVGVGADTPITKNLKGISLASALRLILRELDLTFVVDNEVLSITSREAAEANLQVRVYDVKPLLGEKLDSEALAKALTKALGADAAPPAPASGADAAASVIPQPQPRRIVALQHVLLVRDSPDGHREVANVLGALAQTLKQPAPPATK